MIRVLFQVDVSLLYVQLSGDSVVELVVVAEDNPRESHRSLMVFDGDRPVGGCRRPVVVLTRDHVVRLRVVAAVVVLTTRVVVLVVGAAVVVVVVLLRRLALAVLLVLHPSILKPNLHLPLC